METALINRTDEPGGIKSFQFEIVYPLSVFRHQTAWTGLNGGGPSWRGEYPTTKPESLMALAPAAESPGSAGRLTCAPFAHTNAGPAASNRPLLTLVLPTAWPRLFMFSAP